MKWVVVSDDHTGADGDDLVATLSTHRISPSGREEVCVLQTGPCLLPVCRATHPSDDSSYPVVRSCRKVLLRQSLKRRENGAFCLPGPSARATTHATDSNTRERL